MTDGSFITMQFLIGNREDFVAKQVISVGEVKYKYIYIIFIYIDPGVEPRSMPPHTYACGPTLILARSTFKSRFKELRFEEEKYHSKETSLFTRESPNSSQKQAKIS